MRFIALLTRPGCPLVRLEFTAPSQADARAYAEAWAKRERERRGYTSRHEMSLWTVPDEDEFRVEFERRHDKTTRAA